MLHRLIRLVIYNDYLLALYQAEYPPIVGILAFFEQRQTFLLVIIFKLSSAVDLLGEACLGIFIEKREVNGYPVPCHYTSLPCV